MSVRRLLPVLAAASLVGCTSEYRPPPTTAAKADEFGLGPPPPPVRLPADAVPVEKTTLDALLKGAPATPLVKHSLPIRKVAFTMDAPADARVVPDEVGPRVELTPTAAVLVELGRRDLTADRNPLGPLAPKTIWDAGDALLVESAAGAGDQRFHAVANASVGPIDFTVRLVAPTGIKPGYGTKGEALLALKVARTLATAEPLPAGPVALVRALGGKVDHDAADRVTAVTLTGLCGTRPGLELLRQFPRLTRLTLRACDAAGDDYAVLADLPKLETIDAHTCFLKDAGLKAVAACPKLTALTAVRAAATAKGANDLLAAKQLRSLSLDHNDLAGGTLGFLLDLPDLETLSLADAAVSDTALIPVGRLGKLSSLTLAGNPITDTGMAPLGGLAFLEILDLRNTKVTDAGLARLKGLAGLKTVDVRGTAVTAAGAKSLPGVKVVTK